LLSLNLLHLCKGPSVQLSSNHPFWVGHLFPVGLWLTPSSPFSSLAAHWGWLWLHGNLALGEHRGC
jgi:hypothetical protein